MHIESELKRIDACLRPLGYCFTGLTAVNLYGYGIGTNVFDIAVESDEAVYEAVKLLGLPETYEDNFDPYIYRREDMYYRVQGDLLGDPHEHTIFKVLLQPKDLLLRRLEIYCNYDVSVTKACAWIALTATPEFAKKYRYYWNRL